MAVSMKSDMFGVRPSKFLAMLKHEPQVYPIEQENSPSILIVQTPFTFTRTVRTDGILEKYTLHDEKNSPHAFQRARDGWKKFEAEQPQARLYVTNMLAEDSGGQLIRKLVTEDGTAVWVQKKYLDVFGEDGSSLSDFLLESIPYYSNPVSKSPVRISRQAGCTCGYTMPYVPIQERIYK